jgi:phosphonate transport system permease protein
MIREIFRPQKIKLKNGKEVHPPRPITPIVVIALIIVTLLSAELTNFNLPTIIRRWNQLVIILQRMFPPDWGYLPNIWAPLMDTIKMSLLGTVIGCILSIPFAIISSTNINEGKFSLNASRLFLGIIRTLPALVTALIATYIFGIGVFAGTIALALFTFGIVSKMLYEQIETVDMDPFVAMEALGASRLQAFNAAIVPQVLPAYLSICLYNFEINVRNAAILGYVGAGGIGLILDEQFGWRRYSRAGIILLALFITVIIIESISRQLRERLS